MFRKNTFLFLFLFVVASCVSAESDFPELRASQENGENENQLIVPEEYKSKVRYESNLDSSLQEKTGPEKETNSDEEESLVIIASAAKVGDVEEVAEEIEPIQERETIRPVLIDPNARKQTLDREALTPRGVVKVHEKSNKDAAVVEKINDDVVFEETNVRTKDAVVEDIAVYSNQEVELAFEPSVTYQLETFYFDNGGSSIMPEDRKKIKEIVKIAKEKKAMIYVLGYSSSRTRDMDYVSHKMANFKVSLERAENISNALIKAGLPEKQIMLEALSDSRPAYLEVMPEGERLNRRVEIYISY